MQDEKQDEKIESPQSQSEISERKLAANRANAQLSTGPATEAGKLASSRNSLRHGLAGNFSVLPDEDAVEFNRMQTALIDEHKPATETETRLIIDMSRHYWLYQRALCLQDECFLDNLDTRAVQNRLSLYLRYGTGHERSYRRCLHDFLKLRKDKLRMERGFESQERERAAELRREAREKRLDAEELRRQRAEERREEAFEESQDRRGPDPANFIVKNSKKIFGNNRDPKVFREAIAKVMRG